MLTACIELKNNTVYFVKFDGRHKDRLVKRANITFDNIRSIWTYERKGTGEVTLLDTKEILYKS